MSDLDVAASNAASEETPVVETVETPAEQPVAKSNSEALDRAFEQVSQEPKTVQNRKPDGKFAKGKTEVAAETTEYQAASPEPTPNIAQATFDVNELANFGLTKEALAAAAKADPTFLADAKRRLTELTQGIEKHKAGSENWAKGQKYAEMAQAAGRDVWDVMDQYVQMENVLRERPLEGFVTLAQRLGMNPADLGNALVQMAQGQPYQAPQAQFDPNQLLQDVDGRLEAKLRERDALQQITDFKKDHPRFDELSDAIGALLESKMAKDLPDAYAKAELLNPAQAPAVATPAAAQTPAATPAQAVQPATPDPKTKAKANLSITGSPEGGSNPATRKIPGSTSEALDSAFARVGL
jgi:hypothetical protein